MKALIGTILAAAITLSPPLAGQGQAPDNEKQKQEETKEKSVKPQNPKQGPVTRQQKPEERKQPNRSSQQSPQTAHSNVRRIPAEKFQSNFGTQHHFRVEQLEGRRFRHAGFVFEIVEVWPADWSFDDDLFIEQDADDYFLLNAFHPGVRILVIVVG